MDNTDTIPITITNFTITLNPNPDGTLAVTDVWDWRVVEYYGDPCSSKSHRGRRVRGQCPGDFVSGKRQLSCDERCRTNPEHG